MKNLYITLSFIVLSTVIYGQDKSTQAADKLFDSYQYAGAIKEYTKLVDSNKANDYIYTQLANCNYNISNMSEASKWYGMATKDKSAKLSAETYYRYAQSLKSMGKYDQASKQMNVFSTMAPNDSRAIEYKSNPNYVKSLLEKPAAFTVAPSNIQNNGESDFGAVLASDNTLYFVSNRKGSGKTDKWVNQPYLDIFKVTRNSNGTFSEVTPVSELNSPFHDGPIAISADGNTIFFARDQLSEGKYEKIKVSNVKLGQQGLYKATKVDGKWSNIEALPINNVNYSVTNPSLSKDGKTLYFASNMPGGYGDSDIWKVSVGADGYGKPENLGDKVNTADKESFPYIDEDNVLYFASSGKPGLGGLDVFKIKLDSGESAQNLGKPVNSEKDDFSYSFNKQINTVYFSSNRNGNDIIYVATPICKSQAIVYVTNKKGGAVVANATVTMLDSKGTTIETKQTDSTGKATFDIDCKKGYSFNIAAKNFEASSISNKSTDSGKLNIDAPLTPAEVIITETEVILSPIYFEFDKSNITAQGGTELDKLVKVMNDNPKMVIFVKSHTDTKGSAKYNLNLSEKRAQSTVQYIISKGISKDRISGKGFGASEPKVKCTKCTDEENSQNRRSEFLIVK